MIDTAIGVMPEWVRRLLPVWAQIEVVDLRAENERLDAEREKYYAALVQIAATEPKMNFAREWVNVPVLDGLQAQKVAAEAVDLPPAGLVKR